MPENLTPWTDPELEARIVALVLGEASDFERDQLREILAGNAELAAFQKRIEAIHGLLREASGGHAAAAAEPGPWQLPGPQRQPLLDLLAAASNHSSSSRKRPSLFVRPAFWWSAAACLVILAVASLAPPFGSASRLNRARLVALDIGESRGAAVKQDQGDRELSFDHSQPSFPASPPPRPALAAAPAPAPAPSVERRFESERTASVEGAGGAVQVLGATELRTGRVTLAGRKLEDADERLAEAKPAARPERKSAAPGEESFGRSLQRSAVDEQRRSGGPTAGTGSAAMGGGALAGAGGAVQRGSVTIAGVLEQTGAEASGIDGKTRESPAAPAPAATALGFGSLALEPAPPADPFAGDAVMRSPLYAGGEKAAAVIPKLFAGERFDVTQKGQSPAEFGNFKDKAAPDGNKPDSATAQPAAKADQATLADLPAVAGQIIEFYDFAMAPKDLARKEVQAPTPETATTDEPFSTFSLHVSDVSFKLAQAALGEGQWPDPSRVRIEEFVNAFDYGDPSPAASEPVACTLEQSIHPFQQARNLLRIALRTAAAGRSPATPLRLTLLLDSSGSMERPDRRQTLRAGFAQLANQLQPDDRVTLIAFSRQPRLLADQLPGDQSETLLDLVAKTPSEGGTNLEAALQLATAKAREHFLPGAQNRIVLVTDGAANLGDADPARLAGYVDAMRRQGIAFDAAGIGAEGLNDAILEALSRQGDGRYYLLDRPEDADANFASQLAGAFRPAAKNVKVQVWFNPDRVGRYRLLGFEEHRLEKEDFRDDTVDAAELAAAETGVALYQFEPLAAGNGDAGYVAVRFQDAATGRMIERRWPIPHEPSPSPFERAPAGIRLAASAAFLAAKLGDDWLAPRVDLSVLHRAAPDEPLRQMIQQTRNLSTTR